MNQQKQKCKTCSAEFTLLEDTAQFYKRMEVPLPKDCFNCRNTRLLAFWPFGKFNKRKCDLTGKKIISLHGQYVRYPVYKNTEWYSDKWEPATMDIDWNRPFFDQMYELQSKSPRPHQSGAKNINCDYCDDVWNSKNCYLSRAVLECENVSYSYRPFYCKDSYDLAYCYYADQSYDCTYCFKIFNVKYAFDVRDSFDSSFLYDCRNVRNCFMCWNLRNKEYHILNKPYSKEEYFKKIKEYNLYSFSETEKLKKTFGELIKKDAYHKVDYNSKISNSDGNYLTECKECHNSFFLEKSENCFDYFRGVEDKDCCSSVGLWDGELILNTSQLAHGYNLKHTNYCSDCRDSEYLDFCVNCKNCFGCVGLRNKQFCILNKQYSENEYHALVSRLKEKMKKEGTYGEFFPYKMAAGGYNLSIANLHYEKNREEVERLGSFWEELDKSPEGTEKFIPPDDVRDADESIIFKAIACEKTERLFNITRDELAFLKSHNIPIPRQYPDVRTVERYKQLAVLNPKNVQCSLCTKIIVSYYPAEWNFKKIVCSDCYLKTVV